MRQAPEERCFHIFYQILNGMNKNMKGGVLFCIEKNIVNNCENFKCEISLREVFHLLCLKASRGNFIAFVQMSFCLMILNHITFSQMEMLRLLVLMIEKISKTLW